MAEQIILVNENDQQIGIEEKLLVHQKGLLHRAFSVFIFKQEGQDPVETLIQQRAAHKYHSAGLWTNACCSHPRSGETTRQAAHRRLQEEMGFQVELNTVGHFIYKSSFENGLTEHEFDHVLVGNYYDTPINYNKEEVADTRWISIPDLMQELREFPEKFTAWFSEGLTLALANR